MDKSNKLEAKNNQNEQNKQVEKMARLKLERNEILKNKSEERMAAQEETSKPLLDQAPESNA